MSERDDILEFGRARRRIDNQICTRGLRNSIRRLRDRSMEDMYRSVTVNLSHIASHVLLSSFEICGRIM